MRIVAQEFLAALRGVRSQVAWSRRLGYRSNVAYTWESGRRFPTAAEALRASERSGLDVRASLERFYGANAGLWMEDYDDLTQPEAISALLRDLKGQTSTSDLARRAGLSRYAVTRWLAGKTQPRLPDFFQIIEAGSLRLVDFLTSFVRPELLPSVLPIYKRLEARRTGAGKFPWTQAILRVLEVSDYRALPTHRPGWIAKRLGISEQEEAECVDYLVVTGQIQQHRGLYYPVTQAVDTRRAIGVGRALKSHWARVGVDRIEAGAPGQFSYNVFTCSAGDFERIRELHLAYYSALRQIVASSSPEEHVVIANIQLFKLDPTEDETCSSPVRR